MRIVLTLTIMVSVLGILTAQPIRKTGVDTTVVVNDYIQDEYSAFRDANTPAKVDLLYAPKLIKRFLGPDTDTIKFKYDVMGRLLCREDINASGEYWQIRNYQYSTEGRITLFQEFFRGNLQIEQKWKYNSQGKPISLEQLIDSKRTLVDYLYDINGNEINRKEQYTPEESGISSRVINSTYDSLQRVAERTWYKLVNNNEVPEKKEIYLYPTEDTKEVEISIWNSTVWDKTVKFINYDSLSMMKTVTQLIWVNGIWNDTLRTIQRYKATGEQKELRNEYYTANRWWLSNINYNEYDTLGRVLYSIYDVGHEDFQLHKWRRIYTYDDEGNVKTDELQYYKVLYYVPNEKKWINYDNHGNATLVSCYKWDREYWAAGVGECIVSYNRGKNVESINAAFVAIEYNSFTSIDEGETPNTFTLSQNYPNPFNPSTTVDFEVPKSGMVTLKVYDVLGGEIMTLVNEMKEVGKHSISFDASNLPSGVYFYKLQSDDFVSTKKMVLVK